MTEIERWWQVRRADKRTHWTPEDPNALIAAGKAPAWEGAKIIGPYVPEADLQGAVGAREAAETFLSAWDDWRMGRSTKSDLARAVGALRAAVGGQSDDVKCMGCGTTRAQATIDCPVCDVPRGHVQGRR